MIVKDFIEERYNPKRRAEGGRATEGEIYAFMVGKAITSAVAGALLTNPCDIVRNEMFKPGTTEGVIGTIHELRRRERWRWITRGIGHNLMSVSVPVGVTILLIDVLERS